MTERYFFLHMQKTAGTALWQRMLDSFPRDQLYPGIDDAAKPHHTILVETLVEAMARPGADIRIVTGHFPLCTTELLGGGFRSFTVLRDPVARTLSGLRHYRETTPGTEDLSLEELYEQPERQMVLRNHMVKMLSLTVEEMTHGMLTTVDFTPARLARAKEALAGLEVVGLQERFEPFVDALQHRFGWSLGPPRFANRTRPEDASDALVRRIADDQADDLALYEFGRGLAV